MENNNKLVAVLIGIIIVILGALCILFATGTISFNSNNENAADASNEQAKKTEDEKLHEWVAYILKQDITEIGYYEGLASFDAATGQNICSPVKNMTKDQLKKVLSKMSETTIKKHDIGGLGGVCWEGIKIKYNDTEFSIYDGLIVIPENNDSKVLELLEKDVDIVDNTIYNTTGPRWSYEFIWDNSYIDTLLSE